jgi:hypothetical protein
MLRFELAAGNGAVYLYAVDVRSLQQTQKGQTQIQLHMRAGGNRHMVKLDADQVMAQIEAAMQEESAAYIAACQSRAALDGLLKTLKSQFDGTIQKLVGRHLVDQIGPAVDAHMRATLVDDAGGMFDDTGGGVPPAPQDRETKGAAAGGKAGS